MTEQEQAMAAEKEMPMAAVSTSPRFSSSTTRTEDSAEGAGAARPLTMGSDRTGPDSPTPSSGPASPVKGRPVSLVGQVVASADAVAVSETEGRTTTTRVQE